MTTPPIINILNERVALGPLRRDLIPLYGRWANDFSALRTLGALPPGPTTLEQETRWLKGQLSGPGKNFTIYTTGDWQPIGNTALHQIDDRHRTATFGILIGKSTARGQGYGTEVTRLMLDFAFRSLGLHNVMLTCAAFNLAGLHAYTKAGFREIGRRRQCRLLAGQLWDEVLMDCLSADFLQHSAEQVSRG